MSKHRTWLFDGFVGVVVGGIVGTIVAVNLIITAGIGYDVTLQTVFEENTLVGIATVAILVAGPVIGVTMLRRRRMRGDAIR